MEPLTMSYVMYMPYIYMAYPLYLRLPYAMAAMHWHMLGIS